MKKLIISAIYIIGIVSCNVKQSGVQTVTRAPSSFSGGVPMRWDAHKLPLTVKISNSLDVNDDSTQDVGGLSLIQQMQKNWNDADSARNYFEISTLHTTVNKEDTLANYAADSDIGIYENRGWFPEVGTGVLAVTAYKINDRGTYYQMLHGDIIVNTKDFTFTNDPANIGQYDLPTVINHELGHLIGLGHSYSSSTPSVMYPSVSSADIKRSLYLYDMHAIKDLYNSAFALSAPNALAITSKQDIPDKVIHGFIELHSDGKCVHKLDGNIVQEHNWK